MANDVIVVVAYPRSSFDVAVLARVLYAGLGLRGWRVIVVGRVPRGKVLVESRVPFRLGLSRIVFSSKLPELQPDAIIVDPERRDKPLRKPPKMIIVCLGECSDLGARRHGVLGTGSPVYEAVALLYAYYVRGSRPACRMPSRRPPPSLVSIYLYFARKLLEAVEWFDNHLVLKPSVVAHTLNKAVSRWGLYVDLLDWRVEGEFYTRQVVRVEVYDHKLRRVGEGRVVLDSRERLVRVEGVPLLDGAEFCLDPEHGRVCLGPGECVEAAGGEPSVSPEALESLGL